MWSRVVQSDTSPGLQFWNITESDPRVCYVSHGRYAQDRNNLPNMPDMQALKLMLRILYTAEKVKLLLSHMPKASHV